MRVVDGSECLDLLEYMLIQGSPYLGLIFTVAEAPSLHLQLLTQRVPDVL